MRNNVPAALLYLIEEAECQEARCRELEQAKEPAYEKLLKLWGLIPSGHLNTFWLLRGFQFLENRPVCFGVCDNGCQDHARDNELAHDDDKKFSEEAVCISHHKLQVGQWIVVCYQLVPYEAPIVLIVDEEGVGCGHYDEEKEQENGDWIQQVVA